MVELVRELNQASSFAALSPRKGDCGCHPEGAKRLRDLLFLCVPEGIEIHSEIQRRRRGIS
jgi:hypothetical protein